MLKYLCFLLAGGISTLSAAPRIAVMNFTNNTGSNGLAYLSAALADSIASNLAQNGKIGVVERTQIKAVLNEIALQQSGLFEASQVTQIGKMSKASLLLLGSYSGRADKLIVVIKVVKVETSQVLDGRTLHTSVDRVFDGATQSVISMLPVVLGQDIGYLTVRSNPSGSEIYLDGSLIGVSPLVDYKVGAGKHRIEVNRDGFFPEDKSLTIGKNEHAQWDPLLGKKSMPSYFALSAGLGYFFPRPSVISPGLMYFGRLQYHWKSFHVGGEIAYMSLKHDQEVANPFSATNLTVARRYRNWYVLADFAYYPFPTSQVISPYLGGLVGYVNLRDAQLEGGKYETDNLKLDGTVMGGKFGFIFLPQASFNFFLEVRYVYVVPKVSRKILSGPTITQDITVKAVEQFDFSGIGALFGFTIFFGK